jgi:hypothetical protein
MKKIKLRLHATKQRKSIIILSVRIKMKRTENNWLVAYGVGGCWSGYTDATIIQASTKEQAMDKAGTICHTETAEERASHRGASYDVELIEGDVKNTALWSSRLLPQAKAMLKYCPMALVQ